jgi:cysteinyl-tRNA synthetase
VLQNVPSDIETLLDERNQAKQEKDFKKSDQIRDELLDLGWKILDSREGSRVEKI